MSIQYQNTFTGSNGSAPSDLVLSEAGGTGGTQDIQSNKYRTLTSGTAFHVLRSILPTGNWNNADGEVLITTDMPAPNMQQNIVLRGSGAWAASNDSPTNGYMAHINYAGFTVHIFKLVSSTATELTTTSFTFGFTPAQFRIRFRAQGTALTLTVWDTSGGEPGSPTLSTTDAALAGAGQFMMSCRNVDPVIASLTHDDLTLDNLQTLSPVAAVGRYTPGTIQTRNARGY